MDLNEEFHKETGMQADDGYCYNDYYVEWLESKLEANQKNMDLEAEFYKETKMKAYSYVEWLEERLELEIIRKVKVTNQNIEN